VWSAVVDGRRLTFRLAGINNQNFIMRDEQTGSWWQQVSGMAIHGPLKGRRLRLVPHDQITFTTWKQEQPKGQVLKLDEQIAKDDEYAPADWEEEMADAPTPKIGTPEKGGIEARTLMIGITLDGKSKAWPQHSVITSGVWLDELAGIPLMLVTAADGRSVRAFDRRSGGDTLTFVRAGTDAHSGVLLDLETLSEWNFQGQATKGELAGRQLARVELLLDYWFDWVRYNPKTEVARPWQPKKKAARSPIPAPPQN
jgi:Protein of unknown function (DUF3179)